MPNSTNKIALSPSTPSGRLLFIDGLRGIAAVMVTIFHLYNNNPYHEALKASIPNFLNEVLMRGWLGVQIFFVISGFVIAHSLRNATITARYTKIFILRRSIRLDPPYLATIALWVGLSLLSSLWLADKSMVLPSWQQLITHPLYLQNILGFSDIVPVFWTLCFEVQFYLFFILYLGLGKRAAKGKYDHTMGLHPLVFSLVFASAIYSIVVMTQTFPFAHWRAYDSPWAIKWWHMFFCGVLLNAWHNKRLHTAILTVYMLSIATAIAISWHDDMAVTLATGLLIWVISYRKRLKVTLKQPIIQYLGKTSYSLYLLHFVVGCRFINLAHHYTNHSAMMGWLMMILAFAVSLIAAHLLYFFIEAPSVRFASWVKGKLLATD